MSAFRHIDNLKVRPLEEELAEMGLNPARVLGEIDRQTALLEDGPSPLDPAGVREGDSSARSLAEYGSYLLAEKCEPDEDEDKEEDDDEEEDEGDDSEGMGESDELEESGDLGKGYTTAFKLVKSYGFSSAEAKKLLDQWEEGWGITGMPGLKVKDPKAQKLKRELLKIQNKFGKPEKTKQAVPGYGEDFDDGGEPELSEVSLGKLHSALEVALKNADRGRPTRVGKGIDQISFEEAKWLVKKRVGQWVETQFDKKNAISVDRNDRRAWDLLDSLGSQLYDDVSTGDPELVEAKWIQKAIKDPGRVREYLGVPDGETIPMAKLDAAIEKLKAVEEKTDEQQSLMSALVLAKRLKGGIDEGLDEDHIADLLYLIDEGWELDEGFQALDEVRFQITKKKRGAEARVLKRKRHRKYLKHRGEFKMASKMYRKRFKRKIKRREKVKQRKFGSERLQKLHKQGKRVVMAAWADQIASIQEELKLSESQANLTPQEDVDEPVSIVAEAALNAADTAWYLGEVFDAVGDEAGKLLMDLARKAVALADSIDEAGEPTEEQEQQLETVLNAVVRALAEYESMGSPSLGEAIGIGLVVEGRGSWEELVEYKPPTPGELAARSGGKGVAHGQTMPVGKTSAPDTSLAGKYLKAINMAMQSMNRDKAMAAAKNVVKAHTVMDAKGKKVSSVQDMADVLRVMYYLSQITGLKAPAWMYRGKEKPWFVMKGDEEPEAKPASVDAKMVSALKALGAPAGLLKAMGEEFEHVVDFVFSLDEAGMGPHSVVPGLDPDQERIFDAVVLIASNDGASYRKNDVGGAVKKAITEYKKDAARDLQFDLKAIMLPATREIARRWAVSKV